MNDFSQTVKKDRNRHIARMILGAVLILLETALFYYIWTRFYNPLVRRPYLFKGNFFVAGVYMVVLMLFGNIYGGLKLGYYRVFDLILSQSIATAVTNVVIYITMIIPIATWYLSPLWLIVMTLIDVVLIVIWEIISNQIFVRSFPPQRLILFYGEYEDKLGAKFITRPDRYKLCKTVKLEDMPSFRPKESGDEAGSSKAALSAEAKEDICRTDSIFSENAPSCSASSGTMSDEDIVAPIIEQCRGYDGVVIGDIPAELRNDLVKACYANGIRTYTLPKLTDVILKSSEVLHIFDSPVFLNRNHGLTIEQRIIKRGMDIIISLIATIILSPVMLITALCIKLEDGGPVFFRQQRCTEGGRVFDILKFRSMIPDAEKAGISVPATEKDPRITKVGAVIRAARIDELPQLLNILKGDMSIVGPRPERVEHVRKYTAEIPEFSYRMNVKGGLTGYAQVYGKYNTSAYDKLKLDLMYIQNYSLILDIELILKTIKIVFTKESTEGFSEEQSEEMGK